MKSKIFWCILILAAACPGRVIASGAVFPQIRVVGESEITAAPDHAVITIRIESKTGAARITGAIHEKIRAAILRHLADAGIGEDNTKIDGPYAGAGQTMVSSLTAVVRNLKCLADLSQAIQDQNGAGVQGIEYRHSRKAAMVTSASANALLDAKEKAVAMAGTLDVPLGEAVFIRETLSDVSAGTPGTDGVPSIQIRKKAEVIFRLGSGCGFQSWDSGSPCAGEGH